jgi:serine protease Do
MGFAVVLAIGTLLSSHALAQSTNDDDLQYARSLSRAFGHAAQTIEPSVVHVTSYQAVRVWERDRFGRPRRSQSRLQETGLGSGVIVSRDGFILTNDHVVGSASALKVRLTDGREFEAELVGRDSATDLAVLKIDAEGLAPARFADSESLEVGQWVLAVGSPFGFDSSVTAGIVSAKGRTGLGGSSGERYEEFIQTDAAINPGNSGGPLVNLEGRVVGINNQIATRSGGSVGLGFAIPSAMAKPVMEMIIETGRTERGWFGVDMYALTPARATQLGLDSNEGVELQRIVPGSPADRAGLRAGDVVVEFAGHSIEDVNRLRNAIAFTPPGEPTQLVYIRNGRKIEAKTVLIDRLKGRAMTVGGNAIDAIGVIVRSIDEEELAEAGIDAKSGVVVLDVASDSRADRSGLRAGDVIVGVDDRFVRGTEGFEREIESVGQEPVRLWVVRGGLTGRIDLLGS